MRPPLVPLKKAPLDARSKILLKGLASRFVNATLPINAVNLTTDLKAIATPPFIARNIPDATPNYFNIFPVISSIFSVLPLNNADIT